MTIKSYGGVKGNFSAGYLLSFAGDENLKELKTLYDQELITKEEYDSARKKLLE